MRLSLWSCVGLESWLYHQKVHVVLLFGLEGLGDDGGCFLVLASPQRDAVHLQDDVTHLQLPAVVGGASFLSTHRSGRRDERRESEDPEIWRSYTSPGGSRQPRWAWQVTRTPPAGLLGDGRAAGGV